MNEQGSRSDAESILSAAVALTPMIHECREEIERGRRLPLHIVDALKQAGVFRMTMPRAWGGAELDPLSQLRIIEALSAAGASVGWCVMIGSGSHDFTVSDYFVPEERTYSYQELQFYRSGSLYRFPLNILLKFAAVPLGVAQAALDALIEVGQQPSRLTAIGGQAAPPRALREEEFVQDAVGRAAAMLGAARGYLFCTIGELWETLEAGREVSLRQRAEFQMVHAQVFAMCTEAVELLYKARRGSAVYTGNVLDRCLRDVVTMNQHVINSLRAYAMGGRLLLGLPVAELLL